MTNILVLQKNDALFIFPLI